MGDGQTFAIRLQTSTFYSTRSFSFVEPWFGGRQPVQFSLSLSSTKQYRYDYFTRRADKSQSFEIAGFNIGLAKRLRVPDDYFVLSQSISYQYYNLVNYFTGLFTFGNGESHNIAYNIALSRNNTFTNPIFPNETTEIISKLKEMSVSSLGSLLGVSEKLAGLEPFYPDRAAGRILDMGDVVSLVEKAAETIAEEAAAAGRRRHG